MRVSFDSDDLILAASAAISAAAVVLGELFEHPALKALRVVAVLVTFALTIRRIRQSRPFYKDIAPTEWQFGSGPSLEVIIRRAEHGRGKYPFARCLVADADGHYQECWADAAQLPNGDIAVKIGDLNKPTVPIRVEIRK